MTTSRQGCIFALMFSLNFAWTNGRANNRDIGYLERHRPHYDVTVMDVTLIISQNAISWILQLCWFNTNLGRWIIIKDIQNTELTPYYVNPICCVATVFHQVRCMYWGHLGHFHRAISHFLWYQIVCMRCLVCMFCHMKSINMFSMFLQSGVPRHFLWRCHVFMFMYVNVDLKL